MAKTDNNRPAATDEDRKKYQEAWAEMMVTIWREKIERLHVINTYSLHQQIRDNVISSTDSVSTIQHKFLEYGIYQDMGVGKGYTKGNGGDLQILNPIYREEHGLNVPRKVGALSLVDIIHLAIPVNLVNGSHVLTLRRSWC